MSTGEDDRWAIRLIEGFYADDTVEVERGLSGHIDDVYDMSRLVKVLLLSVLWLFMLYASTSNVFWPNSIILCQYKVPLALVILIYQKYFVTLVSFQRLIVCDLEPFGINTLQLRYKRPFQLRLWNFDCVRMNRLDA